MRVRYVLLGMAFLAVLIFYVALAHAQSSSVGGNLTMAINSTAAYISRVNQSGYLIFYPNLTAAYSELALAKNQSQLNPTYSYQLLAKARGSAQSQENAINSYKSDSLYVLIIFAVILVILLYLLMKPIKSSRRGRK